ncbi:Glycoside hydrolase family 1 protein [Mycena sanguinolenta]|uniref:Glycoside hydrolase family 1 protein n=1 Tax=Mycena sanguinolenta TaxID=230812 RepID=A0A8H6XAQ4_9AGAR|nr:Glycoside hydrolase family 1 protein [Mycena sanguinolenta]
MAALLSGKLPHNFLWGSATGESRLRVVERVRAFELNTHHFRQRASKLKGPPRPTAGGKSIWMIFLEFPEKHFDGRNGDDATDSYKLWRDDISLLARYGVKSYCFSLSWSRIIPLGGRNDPINPKGIEFYSIPSTRFWQMASRPSWSVKLISKIVHISPGTLQQTLYHWDLPQGLHDRYGGWLNKDEIMQDYTNYAKVCFENFGDRVKFWLTMNEPWCVSILGYGRGVFAPGRSSDRTRSPEGDSSTEPWVVGHNVILSHASAVKLYRDEFKPLQGGQIGITLNGDWQMPYDDSPESMMGSSSTRLDFAIGWFADPIYLGHYPPYMQQLLGNRLPQFTPTELALVKGSSDFYGMNTYTTNLCRAGGDDEFQGLVDYTFTRPDGTQLGTQAHCAWLQDYPEGFRALLNYLWKVSPADIRHGKRVCCQNESDMPKEVAVKDTDRVNYYRGITANLQAAIHEDGVDVRAYLAWSLLDNLSGTFADGYTTRFGVTYVDYNTQERLPKESAAFIVKWFQDRSQPTEFTPSLKQLMVKASDAISIASTLSKGDSSLSAIPVSWFAQLKAWVSRYILALLSLVKFNVSRR